MPRVGVNRGPQLGILLLLYQLIGQIGLPNIPPATLVAIALQAALFLGVVDLGWSHLPLSMICLSGHSILKNGDYKRIFIAPLTHGSDIHLYFNMVSLAWKGITLERRYGTIGFTCLIIFFTGSTGLMYVFLARTVSQVMQDQSYFHECAVGFSAVLFALKVVVNHHNPSNAPEDFGFFTVPKKMAVWAELALIQLMVPNASLLGHLAGILTGILSLQFLSAFQMASLPFNLLLSSPGTSFLASFLIGLQFDLLPKAWNKSHFWSSKTSLVCLSCDHVIKDRDWTRLISAPLEHAGDVHFVICFISLCIKLVQLERRCNAVRLCVMTLLSIVGTSVVYVILTFLASLATNDNLYAIECVQGLSGTIFALKIVLLFGGIRPRFWCPWTLFEVAEMLILLERRTLLFHVSGLIVGISAVLINSGSRFPGSGFILGRRSRAEFEPWTRSWGYGRMPRPQSSTANHSPDLGNRFEDEGEGSNSESPFIETRTIAERRMNAESAAISANFPPPPPSGGLFMEVDSQSESSLSPSLDLEEIRRRRLLRFS